MIHLIPPRRIDDVTLEPVLGGGWRVRNSAIDSTDPCGLLGFVAPDGDRFDVVMLRSPGEHRYVETLPAARRVFLTPA